MMKPLWPDASPIDGVVNAFAEVYDKYTDGDMSRDELNAEFQFTTVRLLGSIAQSLRVIADVMIERG